MVVDSCCLTGEEGTCATLSLLWCRYALEHLESLRDASETIMGTCFSLGHSAQATKMCSPRQLMISSIRRGLETLQEMRRRRRRRERIRFPE